MTSRVVAVLLLALPCAAIARAGDWPQYRGDASRSGFVTESLPVPLTLAWTYESARPPARAWPTNLRLRFDQAFQPVIAGGLLVFGSSVDDRVHAFDSSTGAPRWTFLTDGPIRLAPVFWNRQLYVASDDGFLYCLSANDGRLLWKFRGGPGPRMVLGNDRMTSAWPARGGPVVLDGVVYFAAGIWPTDGFHLHALDARNGKPLWSNRDTGSLNMPQPHEGAYGRSGVAAQGYLVAAGTNLLVPTGRAVPAVFDLRTGKLRYFHLATHRRMGGDRVTALGDWFFNVGFPFDATSGLAGDGSPQRIGPMAALSNQGDRIVRATAKSVTAYQLAELQKKDRKGKPITVKGLRQLWSIDPPAAGYSLIVAGRTVISGGRNRVCAIDADSKTVTWSRAVAGSACGLAVANGCLYVSTDRGRIHCFSGQADRKTVVRTQSSTFVIPDEDPVYGTAAEEILARTGIEAGYCLDLGCGAGDLALALARRSKLMVYAVDPDAANVQRARRRLTAAGLYGNRVTVHHAPLSKLAYPKYFANLIVSSRSVMGPADEVIGPAAREISRLQRPYGGVLCVGKPGSMRIRVRGELAGAGSWTHQYASAANSCCSDDSLVKGPLATLWFRDADLSLPPRRSRRPPPLFHQGRLFVQGVGLRAVDAYNGRTLWEFSPKESLQPYNADKTGSNFCASDQGLYVRLGGKCLRLDVVTGKKLGEFQVPAGSDQRPGVWGYIAVSGGLLFGSRSNTDHTVVNTYNRANAGQGYPESKNFWAMDPKTGRLLWTYTARHSIRHNAIAIGEGRVYLIDRPRARMDLLRRGAVKQNEVHALGELLCLDAKTGKILWKAKQIWGTLLALSNRHDVLLMSFQLTQYTLPSERGGRMMAFRASDGVRLWDRKVNYSTRPLINDSVVYAQGGAWDLATGKDRPFKMSRSYGCGQISSSKSLMLFRSATLGYFDLSRKAGVENFGGIRLGCWINAIPVGGLVLVPDGTVCTCSYLNRAAFALQQVDDE
ncbi:MAG: PQQ-binding-like beta-propeller repeat protein [Planctomycetaceae bacterium]|nr:PQQ-binding-like beta-propeller repeat protein [Planctomycetaceae bacterium]